jgi:lipopolysaccharide/colanic/teichoic acid biosynthesis glycosyltransferase
MPTTKMTFYKHYGKRLLDLAIAVPALFFFAPLLILLCVIVRMRLGSPVLFRQPRPGRNGETFHLLKFRTMTDARDQAGNLLPDAERTPAFGHWLRSTSLDELPELWNIITGEMTLVGPRPLLVRYYPYFTEDERRRHDLRPGLTGWAQVNGRVSLGWDQRLALDLWYVDNCTFWLDLKILVLTALKVLRRSDVAPPTELLDFDEERRRRLQLAPGQ